ncbi:hypothetical protein [Rhodoblastus sp.]|uniref:hypothetical protein n=1 Tax=Rhodoblastus sp. TaxID=1962975 RepID=UPI00262DC0B3|nr:hypothetical protein [Rhodoblastus sp.]
MSDPLQFFIPLRKADAARRLITGYATAELPDRSGEICDYASTKPHYEKWSEDFAKASGGKSFGNLRAMHGKVAAGKISSILFNDAEKRIEIMAKIVDDDEWRKIEEGVYTGFSQGGDYVKRWPDPENSELTRYTARPTEISLVDLPCLAEANFELVKADGAREFRNFVPSVAKAQAESEPPTSALRAWLVGNVDSDVEAAETISAFFAALESDLNADPAHDAPLTALLARLKAHYVPGLKPQAEKMAQPLDARLEKLAADNEAARVLAADIESRLAALGARVGALEATPAQPVLLPGFAPVSKSTVPGLDDLAAELARLSPEQASLVLIKAAQTQPRRFG